MGRKRRAKAEADLCCAHRSIFCPVYKHHSPDTLLHPDIPAQHLGVTVSPGDNAGDEALPTSPGYMDPKDRSCDAKNISQLV